MVCLSAVHLHFCILSKVLSVNIRFNSLISISHQIMTKYHTFLHSHTDHKHLDHSQKVDYKSKTKELVELLNGKYEASFASTIFSFCTVVRLILNIIRHFAYLLLPSPLTTPLSRLLLIFSMLLLMAVSRVTGLTRVTTPSSCDT